MTKPQPAFNNKSGGPTTADHAADPLRKQKDGELTAEDLDAVVGGADAGSGVATGRRGHTPIGNM